MASNVKPHQRAFALTIALIFLVTTLATSVFVVLAIIDESKSKNDPAITQTDPTAALEQAAENTCAINVVSGQETLPVPEVYQPAADVTDLETTDLQAGEGAEVKAGDCLVAKYYGTLASNGEKFDENFTTDAGLIFQVGAGNVIQGWDEGIVGMKVGGTRQLVIPSDKAYGSNGQGSIPADSDLIFVVKILEIKQ